MMNRVIRKKNVDWSSRDILQCFESIYFRFYFKKIRLNCRFTKQKYLKLLNQNIYLYIIYFISKQVVELKY